MYRTSVDESKPNTSAENDLQILENGRSWPTWKLKFKEKLKEKSLLNVLEGKERPPGPLQMHHCGHQISNYYNRYNIIERDDQAQQIIKDYVSPVIYKMIMDLYPDIYLRSSSDMWSKLTNLFEELRPGDRHHRLMTTFLELPKFDIEKELDIQQSKLKWLWDELNFEAQQLNMIELPEYVYLSRLVTCLPKEFDEMKLDWEGLPSNKKTIEKLNTLVQSTLKSYLKKNRVKHYREDDFTDSDDEDEENNDGNDYYTDEYDDEENGESYLDES